MQKYLCQNETNHFHHAHSPFWNHYYLILLHILGNATGFFLYIPASKFYLRETTKMNWLVLLQIITKGAWKLTKPGTDQALNKS